MGNGVTDEIERSRHQCEIRSILQKYASGGIQAVDSYIQKVADKRGADTAARLRTEAIAQWQAGNRGKNGEWRELGLKP